MTGFSNLNYVTAINSRRSLTKYVFVVGNALMSWKATMKPSVPLSTIEVGYMALTEAAYERI